MNKDEDDVANSQVYQALNEFYLKATELQRSSGEDTQTHTLNLYHLKYNDRLLAVNSDQKVKVVHKNQEGEYSLDQLNFDSKVRTLKDKLALTLSKEEFKSLFAYMDWNLLANKHTELSKGFIEFFNSARDTIRTSGAQGDYLSFSVQVKAGKLVLDDLLYQVSKQRVFRNREFQELNYIGIEDRHPNMRHKKEESPNKDLESLEVYQNSDRNVSVHEINALLNIIYKLDEQLWCQAVFNPSKEEICKLFTSVSRPSSALERLSTFVGQMPSLYSLADYGYVYRGDEVLQNVFNESEIRNISDNCHDSIADSLIVQNNVNCKLEDSLNFLPPTQLLKENKVITSEVSDFVFTFNQKGVCKVYTVDLGLVEVATINFAEDAKTAISTANDTKKFISQLVQFEVNNVKAEASFSSTLPLNITKEKLQPTKTYDVTSKYKPKKGAKAKVSKAKKKVTDEYYDEVEDVCDIGGLFGGDEEEDFEVIENIQDDSETIGEETKDVEEDVQEKQRNLKVFGYSTIVNNDFKTNELQNIISCVYEEEGKIKVSSRAMHINIQPDHLEFCNFTKFSNTKYNKKKNHEIAIKEIVSSYRSNLLHHIPFFQTKKANEQDTPLICASEAVTQLPEDITSVLAVTETNHSLTDSKHFFILAADKDQKVKVLWVEFCEVETNLKMSIKATAEVKECAVGKEYNLVLKDNKLAIVWDGSIVACNAYHLTDQHSTKLGDTSSKSILAELEKTQFEQPLAPEEPAKKKEKVDNKPKAPAQKQEEEESKEELPVEKKNISVELLKEGDCDLRELDQIFVSRPLGVAKDVFREENKIVIQEVFAQKMKNLDKLKVKLMFTSNSKLLDHKDEISDHSVTYKKKNTNALYEKLAAIELKVHSNTGSQINPTRPPSAMIDDGNSDSYISNYPRPTIVFTHHQEFNFVLSQFTVSSKFHREKANAESYPIGAGLVFCSNSLQEFSNLKKYYQIQTSEQYQRWQSTRDQLNLPLRESEPVAFFNLGSEREVTVSLEETRPCKYVLLMPTDFRKKPIKFTKKFYSNNCEIESFRVTGRVVKLGSSDTQEYETNVNAEQANTQCKAIVEVKQNSQWRQYKEIEKVQVSAIESLNTSYCISLLNKTHSCVTGSFSSEVDLSDIKEEVEAIRVKVDDNSSDNVFWNFRRGHLIVQKFPSTLTFNSKGLKRVNEGSILDLYTDNAKLGNFIKELIKVVHDKNELEYVRDNILQHLNRLQFKENLNILKENFGYKAFLEDPDLYTYSDHFKATIFETINKIGLIDPNRENNEFTNYVFSLLDSIQKEGIPNFDISTMRLIYMVTKDDKKETFNKNYDLLTKFIFGKALPALESPKNYYPISFNPTMQDHISAGVIICRAKSKYELTTCFNTVHSIDYVRLLFDEDTFNLVFSMKISVYEVDHNNKETLIFKSIYGDDVYQLCTRKQESHELKPTENRNYLAINLKNVQTESRCYRVKVHHINTQQTKGTELGQDPVHAIVPLYYGQDTGKKTPINETFKTLKAEANQPSNKLENMLSINGLDFHCYEKGYMYLMVKKFLKKDLKSLPEQEATSKLLSAKRKEQFELIKQRDYAKAKELSSEIKQIKTKSRNKVPKHNNMTLSETLILSSEIMNYLSSDDFTSKDCEYGLNSLPENESYDLLKNILEWYLLPQEKVSKVINLKPAHKISKIILKNISNANSIFFDLIERLLQKKTQTHKKIFETLEPFIKEMSVPEILKELLSRLNIATEAQDQNIDSPEAITKLIKHKEAKAKESMWIAVGTLQIIRKRLQKISKEDKKNWLLNLIQLATLRFKAGEYEHTMYYKLLLNMMRECFKDKQSDPLITDALIRFWFNVLSTSSDPELYNITLKFIEDVITHAATKKKKSNEIVHNVLVWYSELNNRKDVKDILKDSIFETTYENNTETFSAHYCQAIDLFLATFRSDAEDVESNKLVSDIFNNIMSALNKPSKSPSFAKIWNELFKCLAIIGNNEESVDKFVSTFLSLPGEIQDNLYTHFEIDNVNLDSTKKGNAKKFTVSIIYSILRSFFRHGLKDTASRKDQLRVYTICDDLICKLSTPEPCDVNVFKGKTPVKLTEEEYIQTLHLFNEYLNCYMNKGYYNHMAGASYLVLARLKMGVHLSYLVYNSHFKDKKLFELFISDFKDVSIKDKADIIEKQIIWLLLNNPTSKGKSDPWSMNHTRITKVMVESLPTNKELLLELLPNVMKQVIKFDNMILSNCHKLGVERSSAFQNNSNTIISLLFNVCFQDKDLFNDFLVKMKGFDFLLKRLFSKSDDSNSPHEEKKGDEEEEIITTGNGANQEEEFKIENLFEDPSKPDSSSPSKPEEDKKDGKIKEKKSIDKVNFTDAGKTMKLIQSSIGVENQSQDWVMYKNGQRNRVLYKHIDKTCKSDFIMRFECSDVIEVSDIQMGLIYYWGNYDQDMHYEPMQVFCEGGMTKSQIDWAVPLRLADDGGYRQSAVNVYGTNFAHFNSMNYDNEEYKNNPSSIITNKLNDKKQIYKAKYITFRLRRPEICCLESSMFSTVLSKTMSYGFTFFSVQGVYPDTYLPIKTALLDVQKENTLEILSECCSGDLSETFSVIANDKEVIEGFKNSIGKLSQLLEQKEYLIKPIFIALCSQNCEMAEWIIDRFLDINANQKQIRLIGEIVQKDQSKAVERVKKIINFILKHTDSEEVKNMESLSDIIEIFTFFQGMTEKIDIEYNIKSVDKILDKTLDCNEEIQELILSFILYLFELSKPTKDEIMSSEEIVQYLVDTEEGEYEEKTGLKMRLASTL